MRTAHTTSFGAKGVTGGYGGCAVGVTAPPFHPWCRTCTAPWFEDMTGLGERASRDPATGKTVTDVPKGMKYPELKRKFVDSNAAVGYNEDVGGGKMNILPNAAKAVIPIRKFTEYALHPVKSKGKAYAFEKGLGYNLSNSEKLIENIRVNLANFEAKPKGDNGFGLKYEVMMDLLGENGDRASVLTSWIVEHKTGDTRLTSAYIKSGRRKND